MVDATAGRETLSFMDAYSGYNQIQMAPSDQEHTTFITDLKNIGATHQRLFNKMFASLIGRYMEVNVDDMLAKNVKAEHYVADLAEIFDIL